MILAMTHVINELLVSDFKLKEFFSIIRVRQRSAANILVGNFDFSSFSR